jgi:hypothetical protein
MKDRKQLNMHPLNIQAEKILKAAKIPTYPDQMAISTLMLWMIEDGPGIEQLPVWAELSNFQDRYLDLAEAVRDLDQRDPALLLSLVEAGENEEEIVMTAEDLLNLTPEEAALALLEELRWGMEFHPEKYQ